MSNRPGFFEASRYARRKNALQNRQADRTSLAAAMARRHVSLFGCRTHDQTTLLPCGVPAPSRVLVLGPIP